MKKIKPKEILSYIPVRINKLAWLRQITTRDRTSSFLGPIIVKGDWSEKLENQVLRDYTMKKARKYGEPPMFWSRHHNIQAAYRSISSLGYSLLLKVRKAGKKPYYIVYCYS